MFWSKIAGVYDLFETIYNGRVYQGTGVKVAELIDETDEVLECACGTGAISLPLAQKCRKLVATDYAEGMLAQTKKKLSTYENVTIETADITKLRYPDHSFDKVVAGNVLHLLQDPKLVLDELVRVCRLGGKLIIPTYIYNSKKSNKWGIRFIKMFGFQHEMQFTEQSYKEFFENMEFHHVKYHVVRGVMACDIAEIELNKN